MCPDTRVHSGGSFPSSASQRVSNHGVTQIEPFAEAPSHASFWRRRLKCAVLLSLFAWACSASACSPPPARNAPLLGTGVFHPPPKPGDSISHTQMCECKVCDPANCCDGPEDDAPPTECGDSYDFSANPTCGGISVRSCTSRCSREIWRVRAGAACAEKRPASCCRAG